MLTWLDPFVMSLRFIAILSICTEYSRSMKCTKFTGLEVPSDRLTSLVSDEWQRQAWVVSNVSAEKAPETRGQECKERAVARNMAVHFYQRKGIPGRHHSSTAVKKEPPLSDTGWLRLIRLVSICHFPWKRMEVSRSQSGEGARRREWMRAEIRCGSKTVFFLSLASWHVYGEASRMWRASAAHPSDP